MNTLPYSRVAPIQVRRSFHPLLYASTVFTYFHLLPCTSIKLPAPPFYIPGIFSRKIPSNGTSAQKLPFTLVCSNIVGNISTHSRAYYMRLLPSTYFHLFLLQFSTPAIDVHHHGNLVSPPPTPPPPLPCEILPHTYFHVVPSISLRLPLIFQNFLLTFTNVILLCLTPNFAQRSSAYYMSRDAFVHSRTQDKFPSTPTYFHPGPPGVHNVCLPPFCTKTYGLVRRSFYPFISL